MSESQAAEPRCQQHPDRPAIIRKDGVSLGVCQECLDQRVSHLNEARRKQARSDKRPKGLASIGRLLRARRDAILGQADPARQRDDLVGLLTLMDILGEAGAIPGWEPPVND